MLQIQFPYDHVCTSHSNHKIFHSFFISFEIFHTYLSSLSHFIFMHLLSRSYLHRIFFLFVPYLSTVGAVSYYIYAHNKITLNVRISCTWRWYMNMCTFIEFCIFFCIFTIFTWMYAKKISPSYMPSSFIHTYIIYLGVMLWELGTAFNLTISLAFFFVLYCKWMVELPLRKIIPFMWFFLILSSFCLQHKLNEKLCSCVWSWWQNIHAVAK